MDTTKILCDYASQQKKGAKILSKVGVPNFKQHRLDFSNERVLTSQTAFVDIHDKNGAHMSRLIAAMRARKGDPLRLDDGLLYELRDGHRDCGAHTAFWGCAWESEYLMANEQELFVRSELSGTLISGAPSWYLTTYVPYTSVCPCSAEMVAEADYGYPHMQRATAKIVGQLDSDEDLNEVLTNTVATVLRVVGLVPQPFMKRQHELEWCKNAMDNKLFVEDSARLIAEAMDDLYTDYTVEALHEESIHQHNVFAMHRKGEHLL